MVIVDVFTMGWNEEKVLPHFIDHYKKFCRNVTFYNNCSTDNSVEICKSNGVEVINTGLDEINEFKYCEIKQNSYKNSDADFVIVVDTDEFVYHPDIIILLENYKNSGVTLPKTRGYTMSTNDGYPEVGQIINKIKRGIPSINYAKRCIFNPKLDIKWAVGCHKLISVDGKVKESDQEDLSVLHYKFIDRQEIHSKKLAYSRRMSEQNKTYGFATHYNNYDYNETEKWFDDHIINSILVI
jgi:glycosyltransferase involved in cell wall biosynthesis